MNRLIISLVIVPLMTFDLKGSVIAKDVKHLKVYLNNIYETRVDIIGHFSFHNLPSGKYQLTIPNSVYEFPQFEVSITEGRISAFEIDEKRNLLLPLKDLMGITPKNKKEYFELEQAFELSSLLRGPYGIMIIVSLGLLLFMKNMPKMEA